MAILILKKALFEKKNKFSCIVYGPSKRISSSEFIFYYLFCECQKANKGILYIYWRFIIDLLLLPLILGDGKGTTRNWVTRQIRTSGGQTLQSLAFNTS
jgi:hypothetical protein